MSACSTMEWHIWVCFLEQVEYAGIFHYEYVFEEIKVCLGHMSFSEIRVFFEIPVFMNFIPRMLKIKFDLSLVGS